MKNNFDRNQRATLVAALVLAVGWAGGAQAATTDRTWNGPGLTGNWDTSDNNWTGTPVGTPWAAQGNSALFDTADNQVTVNENIAVDNWSIGSKGNRVTVDAGKTITENYNNNPGVQFLIFGPNHTIPAHGNIMTINGTFNFGPTANASDVFQLGSDGGSVGSSYNGIVVNSNGTLRHVTAPGGTRNDEVGKYAGANCNYMDINGGLFDRGANQSFSVGVAGSSNYMTIRNGGKFTGGANMPTLWSTINNNKAERELHIGSGVGGSFNHVDVTGQNAAAYVVELLTVGNATNATDNYLKVENGGNFYGAFLTYGGLIGGVNGADNNYVRVTGSTSALNLLNRGGGNLRRLTIGAVGTTANNNHLDVYNGATATLICGVILAGSNSKFNLGDGTGTSTAYIGNTSVSPLVNLSVATAQLIFDGGKLVSRVDGIPLVTGPGTVNLNGPATIDTTNNINSIDSVITGTGSLTITNFGTGKLTLSAINTYSGDTIISGGILALSGSGSVHSSSNLIVSSGATFDVSGVTTPPYSLTSGQTLKGNGGVKGAVIVASGATVAPGTSIGTLYFTNAPTLSGTVLMEINSAASLNADKLVVVATGGPLTYGGTLTITNTGGTLQSGDTFDLFDAASFGGSFATINTPTLPAGLAWDTTTLTTNGTIKVVCGAPVGGADAFSTPTNTPVAIAAAKFKLNDTGCGLSLTAVQNPSTQGGTLSLSATNGTVTYTPPSATFGGTDTFTYTLLDLSGSTANVTVTVTVGSGTSQSPNVVYGPSIEGSEFVVRFAGHPGWEYTVEYSPISPVNWTKKVNKIAPLNNAAGFGVGVFEFRDPLADSGLYRTVHPSY